MNLNEILLVAVMIGFSIGIGIAFVKTAFEMLELLLFDAKPSQEGQAFSRRSEPSEGS